MNNFDPKKPYNDLPFLPALADFNDVDLWKKVVRASDALSKLNGQVISTLGDLNTSMLMLSPLFAPEAVASLAVENIITTTDEVLRAGANSEIDLTPQQKEGRRYQEALMTGNEMLRSQGFLNTNSFLRIQEVLISHNAGIRTVAGQVEVDPETGKMVYTGTKLANPQTGEVYYTPPVGKERLLGLLKNLEDFLNQKDPDLDPLIKMAIIHYQFESIHPFYDGNGRTGRILMPLYLVLSGKLNYPVLFLSRYILDHRGEYYRKLRAVTKNNEWLEWVHYILTAVEEQASKTSDALLEVVSLKDGAKLRLMSYLPKPKATELVEFIFTRPSFTRQQMSDALGVHVNTARTYADLLVENGLVDARRHKKSWVYSNVALIRVLSSS